MKRVVYDLETNGLLYDPTKPDQPVVSKVHCLVLRDFDTDVVRSFYDEPINHPTYAGTILQGIAELLAADIRIAHNGINYDEPVLRLLYSKHVPPKTEFEKIRDTIIGARVGWPEEHLSSVDYSRRGLKDNHLPVKFIGRHSLKAWGYRLNILKGTLEAEEGEDKWDTFTVKMLDYCIQDTNVTRVLCKRVLEKKVAPRMAWVWEQKFAERIAVQVLNGFPFSKEKADELLKILTIRRAQVSDALQNLFPPEQYEHVTPVKKKKTIKTKVFNPGSRVQISQVLASKYGWKPTEFTPTGRPKVEEETLQALPYAGAKELAEYLMLSKRMGAVSDGKESWIKHVQADGRIHGRVNHNAAVTNRCTHSGPNVTQVPSPHAPYGTECRACFYAPAGWKLVGVDAAGLELRMLAHYMAVYDGGEYIAVVTTGSSKLGTDVHTVNMRKAGLDSRDVAKVFIYAFLYGAGDPKLALSMGKTVADAKRARAKFLKEMPALRKFLEDTKREASIKRKLVGLDGRFLHVRSAHAAPNTRLQGAGAVVMKYACVIYSEKLESMGLVSGVDWMQVHAAHDEYQILVKEEHAETVGKTAAWAIEEAGRVLGVVCPLAGEYKIGNNWAETH